MAAVAPHLSARLQPRPSAICHRPVPTLAPPFATPSLPEELRCPPPPTSPPLPASARAFTHIRRTSLPPAFFLTPDVTSARVLPNATPLPAAAQDGGARIAAVFGVGPRSAGLGPGAAVPSGPLRRRVRPPPLTDPEDQRAAAKRFGWLGAASGVAVERLWPSPERLREMEEEEREWCPSLREMEAALERKEQEERRLREGREQLVARSLAAMPARIAAWRQEREQMRERSRQDAARRQRLLAEAAERLGAPARPGDPRVQAVMQDLERERRRQEKRQRRQQHEEATRSALAAAEAAAASQPPPLSPPRTSEPPPVPTQDL
eukprot:XP_015155689.2 growth arrest and DNA damage-inducible proteins-interacting protein 1 [Gallus gallus]